MVPLQGQQYHLLCHFSPISCKCPPPVLKLTMAVLQLSPLEGAFLERLGAGLPQVFSFLRKAKTFPVSAFEGKTG